MADERKWEDLQTDCLINIFTRLDTVTIAESVQHTCKSWYQATTLNPQCWQNLIFTQRLRSREFVEFAVARSQLSATSVIVPHSLFCGSWRCIAEGCPLLKILEVSTKDLGFGSSTGDLIHHWRNLECLKLYDLTYPSAKLLEAISLHCKSFNELSIPGSYIRDEQAALIVRYLPKIKVLGMNTCFIQSSSLVMILKGCRELEFVDISDSVGFRHIEDVDEIIKLGWQIKSFNTRGSSFAKKLDAYFSHIDKAFDARFSELVGDNYS